jgi:formylglycine-generating enzyme required for sulfatase activity
MPHVLRRRWPILIILCPTLCGCGPTSPPAAAPTSPPAAAPTSPPAAAPTSPPAAGVKPDSDEPDLANTIGMKLKLIKAGKFLMGSPKDEKGRFNEGPQHEVEITKPFYMGVCPVTRGQFAAFVKDAAYQTEAEKNGDSRTWRKPGFDKYDQSDDDPVVCVSWNDAVKFCEWLSNKEKKTYELPTEAEWEYACRAGTKTAYSFGDDPKDLGDFAWFGEDFGGGHTHPVGLKKPNPWGLYDMHGNVWQWCADGYDKYQEGSIKDPKGKESANSRVLRGGSWRYVPRLCRPAGRYDYDPAYRGDFFGFRVVLRLSARTP